MQLLDSAHDSVEVGFRYREWAITVRGNGSLVVEPADPSRTYRCVCRTCGEEWTFGDRESAQEVFNTHAERQHETELRRLGEERGIPSRQSETESLSAGGL